MEVLATAVAMPNAAFVLAISPPLPLAMATAEAVPVEASIIDSIIAMAIRTASFFLTSCASFRKGGGAIGPAVSRSGRKCDALQGPAQLRRTTLIGRW